MHHSRKLMYILSQPVFVWTLCGIDLWLIILSMQTADFCGCIFSLPD